MRWLSRLRESLAQLRARREELVGINQRNVLLVYPNNKRRDFPLADDKLLAKERFATLGVPTPETLAVCDGLYAVPSTVAALQALEHFVLKPASGGGGQGILVVGERLEPGVWRRAGGATLTSLQLQRHMADILFGVYSKTLEDRAFVERRIVPHAFFQGLWADGLCDLRVITLQARPLMAMIRVPTAESGGRANLHQGGLGIALELETGRSHRALHHGLPIERHPESGTPLLGLQVPDWERVLEVAGGAARSVPLGYLGVDIVLDQERGPLVLEINARPGLEIQNVHGSGLGKALRRLSA
jgi:alpha-L-glutamate ligase-like protein